MEKCWKLHGYPPNNRPSNTWKRPLNSNAHATIVDQGNTEITDFQPDSSSNKSLMHNLTPNQFQKLLNLINDDNPSAIPETEHTSLSSAHLAGTTCLLSQSNIQWLLDSGASDHMCFNHQFLILMFCWIEINT